MMDLPSNGYALDREYIRNQLDKFWTSAEQTTGKIAVLEHIVTIEHDRRLRALETRLSWIFYFTMTTLVGVIFALVRGLIR